MSEQEMNSYRFTSGQEPSDEMLEQLMKEVAQDASIRQKKATDEYFKELHCGAKIKAAKWAERINNAING